MKYYAKLQYKGKVVGYRYEHKGKFYDIESNRKAVLRVEESNSKVLDLVPHGELIATEEEIANKTYSEDLTNNLAKFYQLQDEDKQEQIIKTTNKQQTNSNQPTPKTNNIIETKKEETNINTDKVDKNEEIAKKQENKPKKGLRDVIEEVTQKPRKEYKLDNKPTKKKVQTSKGVGVTILGCSIKSYENVFSKHYAILLTVTSKTAITNVNKILGAKFNEKARLKDFEKGVTEFKLHISDILLNEMIDKFGITPCLSTKSGLVVSYDCLDEKDSKENEKTDITVKAKIRLTDFALSKGTAYLPLRGTEFTLGEYRDLVFDYCNTGKYTLLADL